jgi:selenocysteine lyase/cysteine desulfurase
VRDVRAPKCGIVTFNVEGKGGGTDCRGAATETDQNTTSGASGCLENGKRDRSNVVRASVHYSNSEARIERFGTAGQSLLNCLSTQRHFVRQPLLKEAL